MHVTALIPLLLCLICSSSFSQRISMDDFFGVNVFGCQESPQDIDDVASWVRDYTQWEYFEPVNDQFQFSNARRKKQEINYDAYYQKLKAHAIRSLFVVMRSPRWASSHQDAEKPEQFAPSGEYDGSKPEHYKEAAEFYYQLASRYGNKKHLPKELLTTDKSSGLNLISVIEVGNEPDGMPDWGNQMTLEQYAALLNAVYDGNNGSLGTRYGIKAADPDMPVSIGGLAFNLEALKKIIVYAGRQPFDIINVHFYTFHYIRENYRVAIPPEWSSLAQDMKEIIQWRNANAMGKPVWLTEIGWDTKDHNTEYVTEQEAANYLIRSYLLALGAGIEKCFWFIFKDLDNTIKPIVFSSSGLFENETFAWSGPTRLKPKTTYWYNATFKRLTSGYFFEGHFSLTNDSTVYQYHFFNTDKSKRLTIAWYCPKMRTRWNPAPPAQEKNCVIPLPSGYKISRVVRAADGTDEGKIVDVKNMERSIELTLTGTPVFIEMNLE